MILRMPSTLLDSHSTTTLTLAIFSYLFEAVLNDNLYEQARKLETKNK